MFKELRPIFFANKDSRFQFKGITVVSDLHKCWQTWLVFLGLLVFMLGALVVL